MLKNFSIFFFVKVNNNLGIYYRKEKIKKKNLGNKNINTKEKKNPKF